MSELTALHRMCKHLMPKLYWEEDHDDGVVFGRAYQPYIWLEVGYSPGSGFLARVWSEPTQHMYEALRVRADDIDEGLKACCDLRAGWSVYWKDGR